jgi:hypothetical protein
MPRNVGVDRRHSCLKSCCKNFDNPERDSINLLLEIPPQEKKNPSDLDLATKGAMQSALDSQSSFLNTSRSTTAGRLSHSALQLRRPETTTSSSQLEAPPQAAPVEQVPQNRGIVERSASQLTDEGPRQCPLSSKPNSDAEADLRPTFTYGIQDRPLPRGDCC